MNSATAEGGLAVVLNYMSLGGTVMWVIFAVSVIALAVIIERLIFFAAYSGNETLAEDAFKALFTKGGDADFAKLTARRQSIFKLFADAYANWEADGENLMILLDARIRREIYAWQKNLSFLETAAKVSPLLGLLGTVLGMVEMFRTLNLGGAVNAETVTGGIWKALFTTVAGLVAAIPIIIIHSLLVNRIDREEEKLRRGVDFIMRRRMGAN